MTDIRITEFKGYSKEDFYQFLRIHHNSFYDIIIPKEYGLEQDGDLFLQDYFNILYASQLLARISHNIMWSNPDPMVKGEFSLIIITTRLKRLANLLYYFSNAFDWETNEDAYINFQIAALNTEGFLRQGEVYACPSYVTIINEYNSGNDD